MEKHNHFRDWTKVKTNNLTITKSMIIDTIVTKEVTVTSVKDNCERGTIIKLFTGFV